MTIDTAFVGGIVSNIRPESFPMQIQGGMLEALGINMYTSLGKCLVEFVANAYDSNAESVTINIPFDAIAVERQRIKDERKKQKKDGAIQAAAASGSAEGTNNAVNVQLPDVSIFNETMDSSIQIVIEDKGHGMNPDDVVSKFLPVNRHRRADANGAETELKSEGGRRNVMGRKGLGKLAGFGTAEEITIFTKREGDAFRTKFVLSAKEMREVKDLATIKIPAAYEDAPSGDHGTRIVLAGLKPDAVKSTQEKINQILAEAFFGIKPEEFKIELNDEVVEDRQATYEFVFPQTTRDTGQLAVDYVNIPDLGSLRLEYAVKFRGSKQHLSASRRGGRIYCNNRLAAGPSLFKLPSGMHNFHAQDYMEGIFIADDLDRLGIDFVNTNRTQLREDNDVVDAVLQHVSDLMFAAINAHAKFKDIKVVEEIENDPKGKMMKSIIDQLPSRARGPATKLLKTIAIRYGTDTDEFRELAPLVVQSMNAGEVLIRLVELQSDPGTIQRISRELADLAEIEKADALKLYRGRRNGIIALRNLIEKGESLWKKKGIENELHSLFKRDPWLIKPEFSNYLASDENLNRLASKVAKILEVDSFSKITNADGTPDKERPDLVFLMSDSATPYVFTIVELKSPTIPLDYNHLTQLQKYIAKVERFINVELKKKAVVNGYLIGAMPAPESMDEDQMLLIQAIEKPGVNPNWEVIGLEHLLLRAQTIHSDAIDAFESDLKEGRADQDGETAGADGADSVENAATDEVVTVT